MQTGWLDVCFQQPISFSDTRPQQPPLVEKLICGDGVFVENRTIEAGQQVSYDRMQLKNLDLNNITRRLSRRRAGLAGQRPPRRQPRVCHARRAARRARDRPATVRPVGFGPQQPGPSDPNQLTCIHLRFMKSITGNKIRKDLVFHGQVRTAYAPAQSWTTTLESDDPKRLGPQAVVLHCDNLAVDDMSPVSGSSGGNLELTALDNVIAEGTNFTARCARLTYAQAKELLILEGDGRSDAELFKQEGEGGQAIALCRRRRSFTSSRPGRRTSRACTRSKRTWLPAG